MPTPPWVPRSRREFLLKAGGGFGAVVEGPIYFPPGAHESKLIEPFASELRIIDDDALLTGSSDPLEAAVITRMLRKAGVTQLDVASVVQDHVLPMFERATADADAFEARPRKLIIAYWRFLKRHWDQLNRGHTTRADAVKLTCKLSKHGMLPVSSVASSTKAKRSRLEAAGLARLSPDEDVADVRFALEHGNKLDVLGNGWWQVNLARQLGWKYAAIDELAESNAEFEGWRRFLGYCGVVAVARARRRRTPLRVTRTMKPWALHEDGAAFSKLGATSDEDMFELHDDVYSPGLEALVERLAIADDATADDFTERVNAAEQVVKAACTLARALADDPEAHKLICSIASLRRPGAGATRLVPSQALGSAAPNWNTMGKDAMSVPSSTLLALQIARWLPDAIENGTSRRFRPRELCFNNESTRWLGGEHVHFVHDCARSTTGSTPDRALELLGVKTQLGTVDVLDLLHEWGRPFEDEETTAYFSTTVRHAEAVYRHLQDALLSSQKHAPAIRELFSQAPVAWVPDYRVETSTDECGKDVSVRGRFYRLSDCVWSDYSKVLNSLGHKPPRVLQQHYPYLFGFFCRNLCATCFGSGLGSRGERNCKVCQDVGVSAKSDRSFVSAAAGIQVYVAKALELTETRDFADARGPVIRLLNVLSFAVLTGRLGNQIGFLTPLLRSKAVLPTIGGGWASVEQMPLINDKPSLSELFRDEPELAIIDPGTWAKIARVPDQKSLIASDLDLIAGIPGQASKDEKDVWRHGFLLKRLMAMRDLGVRSVPEELESLPMDVLLERFQVLAENTLPLLAHVETRFLSDDLSERVVPGGSIAYTRHALHDTLSTALLNAQRLLWSAHGKHHKELSEHGIAARVAALRLCICDELDVVVTLRHGGGEIIRTQPKPAFLDGDGGPTLYVRREDANRHDPEVVLKALFGAVLEAEHDDALLSELVQKCQLAHFSSESFDREYGPMPPEQPLWVATALESADAAPPMPPGVSDADATVDEDEDEDEHVVKRKPRRKADGRVHDGAAWPPTAAVASGSSCTRPVAESSDASESEDHDRPAVLEDDDQPGQGNEVSSVDASSEATSVGEDEELDALGHEVRPCAPVLP